jgi:Caspase domain/WD domain, G-beta repeat
VRRSLVMLVICLLGLALADRFADVQILRTLEHTAGVRFVAFSPDGHTVATGSVDKKIRLWDVSTGELLRELTGHAQFVNEIQFSPEGRVLASVSDDRTIRLWNVTDGKLIQKITGPWGYVENIEFNSDGTMLLSGSSEKLFRLWNVLTGKTLQKLAGAWEKALILKASFRKNQILIAGNLENNKREIYVWDASTGKQVYKLEGHLENVNMLQFSSSGNVLTSSSNDKRIFWDMSSGKSIKEFAGKDQRWGRSSAVSSDETIILSSSGEKTQLWNFSNSEALLTIPEGYSFGSAIAFSPDGRTLASGDKGFDIRLWGTEDNSPIFGASPAWLEKHGPKTDPAPATTSALSPSTTVPATEPASKPAPSSPAATPTETAPPINTQPRANIRALVIGIGNYQEDRIPKLEYAESDAKRFADALKNPRIGNIKAENIETMIGPRATKNRFETRSRTLASQTKPGETLIVYYSGHGAPDPEKNQPWLVPWDADPNDLASSAIALEWLQTLPLAGGNLVLILDSCFSGETGSRSVTAPNARPFGVQVKAPATTGNVTVLSATSGSQSSFEGPSTGGGYFTTYLIEGMSGKADTNTDGTVTLEEAMRYATPKVTLEASKRNAKQTPELRGNANFVLGLDAATLASKGVQTRVDKLAALAQTGKISADQFLALEKLVENANEPDPLRRYLDGELKEDDFVKLLKNGLVHPSVPKR